MNCFIFILSLSAVPFRTLVQSASTSTTEGTPAPTLPGVSITTGFQWASVPLYTASNLELPATACSTSTIDKSRPVGNSIIELAKIPPTVPLSIPTETSPVYPESTLQVSSDTIKFESSSSSEEQVGSDSTTTSNTTKQLEDKRAVTWRTFVSLSVRCPSVMYMLEEMDSDPERYPQFRYNPRRRPDPALNWQAAMDFFLSWRDEVCYNCDCHLDSGSPWRSRNNGRCRYDHQAARCKEWMGCYCTATMKGTTEELDSEPFKSVITRFNQLPQWVKDLHPNHELQVGGRSVSWSNAAALADYFNQPRTEERYEMLDATEPYYLEGPDIADERWMEKGTSDAGIGRLNSWPFNPNDRSGLVSKRELAGVDGI
ncbi:hypothetical protein TWF106_010308 [Orbilia oligospora]|uniref:Uncharacterized protein n=1 Tax=Orbilia oligospora TaxID=2813651 RepID=A0A7C8Q5L3_ORBOL|nr:hypothetical protein TWF788_000122 [Orbilia oligospora]KAF3211170.1 hypothetical protein TWF106_010308 [Orbilia oligospora]